MKCLLPSLALLLSSAVAYGQPAATPRTDEAAKTIERQVQQLSTRRPALAREYLFSIAAMNYVQSRPQFLELLGSQDGPAAAAKKR